MKLQKIFVDTDIILDLLTQRSPFYTSAAKLFSRSDQKKIELCISALTFSHISYFLNKNNTSEETKKILLRFKTLVTVLAVDNKIIDLSLASDFKDFEDAIQYYTAIENNSKLLLTRNIKDFKRSMISIMTTDQYLKETL